MKKTSIIRNSITDYPITATFMVKVLWVNKQRTMFHYLIMILNKIIQLQCQPRSNVSIIITMVMMTSLIRNSHPIAFIPVTISIAIAIAIAIAQKNMLT